MELPPTEPNRPPRSVARPTPPRMIAGFELIDLLGEGGMGRVFRARHRALDRIVALKLLTPEAAGDFEFVERFTREARAAAALQHPSIVSILDFGRDPATGSPFMALEYVDGEDLEHRLKRDGKLTERGALRLIRAVLGALAHAHEHGLVHRDIKPANILLPRRGPPKLADLGLAKRQTDSRLTETGILVGTPRYMSPEQANGDRLDIRSDLYSLGLVLFRMLTGGDAFVAPDPISTITRRLTEDCPDPRAAEPEISAGAARIVAALTARDPDARVATPTEAMALVDRALAVATKGGGSSRANRPLTAVATISTVVALAAVTLAIYVVAIRDSATAHLPDSGPLATAGGSAATPAGEDDDHDDGVTPPEIAAPIQHRPEPQGPDWWRTDPRIVELGLDGLIDVLGTDLWRHPAPVGSVSISADGARVLSVSIDGSIAVWDVATNVRLLNKSIAAPAERGYELGSGALTDDGTRAIVGAGNLVQFWDVDGDRHSPIPVPTELGHACAIAVVPSDRAGMVRLAIGGTRGLVRIVDVDLTNTRNVALLERTPAIARTPPVSPEVSRIELDPDREHILVTHLDGHAEVWALATRTRVAELPEFGWNAWGAAFAPDARSVFLSAQAVSRARPDEPVRLGRWRFADGAAALEPLPGASDDHTRAVRLLPDGDRLLAANERGDLVVRTLASGEVLRAWNAIERGSIQDLAVTADGRVAVTGGSDGRVRLWDVATGQALNPDPPIRDDDRLPDRWAGQATSPEGLVAVADRTTRSVALRRTPGAEPYRRIELAPIGWTPVAVTFVDGDELAIGTTDGVILIVKVRP